MHATVHQYIDMDIYMRAAAAGDSGWVKVKRQELKNLKFCGFIECG
jgi:hypothetical protein